MKLYLASSWRNEHYPALVRVMRAEGHEVFDWRSPKPEACGFHWSEIDRDWRDWTPDQFKAGLYHPKAMAGFNSDYEGMQWADACVLVLPCGRSAHLEAGWFDGKGKPLYILLAKGFEVELMYHMSDGIFANTSELLDVIGSPSKAEL